MPLGASRINFLAKTQVAVRSQVSVTAIGNAQVDTAQSKIGGASLLLDGTGDWLEAENSDNFAFGTGDFTLETWIYPKGTQAAGYNTLLTNWNTSPSALKWYLAVIGTFGSGTSIQLQINGSSVVNVSTGTALALNTWYHIAAVRTSGQVKIFLDGTQLGSDVANSADITTGATDPIGIGVNDPGTLQLHHFNGHFDEIRISNSARYTTGFTPSTSAFSNDADTVLLLHCDGTDGSTTFTDDNGV